MSQTVKYLKNSATSITSKETEEPVGTITIGNKCNDFDSNPADDLKKYFEKGNSYIDKRSMIEVKQSKSNFYLSKTGYSKHVYGYVGDKKDKFIFIASEPVGPGYMKMYDFKITFHQSQWRDQREIAETFVQIFGWKNAKTILLEGEILRFDAWIDIEISYDILKKFVYRPKVSITEKVKKKMRTLYLGSKKPKVVVMYEKNAKDIRTIDVKRKVKEQ